MAIRKVSIKIRIKTPEGKRMMVNPVWETKGRLKPLYARVGGKPEHHPEGVYVLRYGTKWEFVGQAADVVLATKLRREQELEDKVNAPIPPPTPVILDQSGLTILEAMETYVAKKALMDPTTGKEALAPKSISDMRRVIEAFQRASGKTYLREVTGDSLVGYFSMLRTQANLDPKDPNYTEKLRKRNVTVKSHYATLMAFFKRYKINIADLLEEEQVPRCRGRIPEAYTENELSLMWKAAKPEEKIRLQFFVASGLRRGEVAHLTWDDIDLNTGIARVTPKAGWKPKNRRSREVSLPDWLVALLKERREKNPNDVWVFPTARGNPARFQQLLNMIKAVAKRAGIKGRVDIHKFRSTYASLLNKSGKVTVEEISGRLGHADIVTTRLYLERMNQNTDRAKQQTNDVFAKLA